MATHFSLLVQRQVSKRKHTPFGGRLWRLRCDARRKGALRNSHDKAVLRQSSRTAPLAAVLLATSQGPRSQKPRPRHSLRSQGTLALLRPRRSAVDVGAPERWREAEGKRGLSEDCLSTRAKRGRVPQRPLFREHRSAAPQGPPTGVCFLLPTYSLHKQRKVGRQQGETKTTELVAAECEQAISPTRWARSVLLTLPRLQYAKLIFN